MQTLQNPKGAGPKKKPFDQNTFEKLCVIHATEEEIANWFDVSISTIVRRCSEIYNLTFAQVYKKFGDQGKISIRRKQMQVAMSGNVSMLIWLGKQTLGQADKQEQKIEFEGDVNFSKKAEQHNELINRRFNIPV